MGNCHSHLRARVYLTGIPREVFNLSAYYGEWCVARFEGSYFRNCKNHPFIPPVRCLYLAFVVRYYLAIKPAIVPSRDTCSITIKSHFPLTLFRGVMFFCVLRLPQRWYLFLRKCKHAPHRVAATISREIYVLFHCFFAGGNVLWLNVDLVVGS